MIGESRVFGVLFVLFRNMSLCSYAKCLADTNTISHHQEFCEIKTVIPKSVQRLIDEKEFLSTKKKRIFLVKWSQNGEAKLHKTCWDDVLKLSRQRSKKVKKNKVSMSEEEKQLVKEAAKTVELFDSQDKIQTEGRKVAELIKTSQHCVCFTGAGISTSAGIGDYRGKSGKWTQQDQEKITNSDDLQCQSTSKDSITSKKLKNETTNDENSETENEDDGVNYEDLRPTYTHEALQKLIDMGLLKYIISQNGDGLHTLSQVPPDNISELHGNVFIEKCERCNKRYERSYYVMDDECSQYFEDLEDCGSSDVKKPAHAKQCHLCSLSHRTGRKCTEKGCKGYLIDTIINFKDNLEDDIYKKAEDNASKSDVMLCLGTTLLVSPANELVEMTREPQTIVICNRQKTPLDYLFKSGNNKRNGSRVFGNCDVFMKEIMKHILNTKDLETWENSRLERLELYHKLRKLQ